MPERDQIGQDGMYWVDRIVTRLMLRAGFARSRWRDLRIAGVAYADLGALLRTAHFTDGHDTVWSYQRLSAACAQHGRPLTTPANGE